MAGTESNAVSAAIGARVRAAREERGLGLNALARLAGVSNSTLSRFERGLGSPTVDVLVPITRALAVTVGEMLGEQYGSEELHRLRRENAKLKKALREMTR